jgi:prepilin-type N-terminal cleavage/methylation domain-containing protein
MRGRAENGRGARRGFTLVELMVAMLGGMFVSIAVFTLAKHSSSFAMRQSRVADATLQSVIGFERLKADIARAGFLSTPNLRRDPHVCRSPSYPSLLGQLASVFIDETSADDVPESANNGITPRRILLAGSYASADQFIARNIVEGPPVVVHLEPNSLGMANIGYHVAPTDATLLRVFAIGRALRIVDDVGDVQFATITGVAAGATPTDPPQIELASTLQFRSTDGNRCGIHGHGRNVVNVVNLINYEIRDLNQEATSQFAPMFRSVPALPYEATRRELIREELAMDGSLLANTGPELIAEYAVDLGFSLLVEANGGKLTRLSDGDIAGYAGVPGVGAGDGPQLIRGVHAWLSVRSQEADRTTALPVPILPAGRPGPNLIRVSVNADDGELPPFARVRTLQSTIPLYNQARATWR